MDGKQCWIIAGMKARGCLIAVGVVLAVLAMAAAVFGPGLVRRGQRIYEPIAKMQKSEQDFDAWKRSRKYRTPKDVELTSEQLDRFLKLRRAIEELNAKRPSPEERFEGKEKPGFDDVEGMLGGLGASLVEGMELYKAADMTPDEYRYIGRIIYVKWLRPLKRAGNDPAAIQRVAQEIRALAASATDAGVARALRQLADEFPKRRVEAPEGVPPAVHALLLPRAQEIDALADAVSMLAGERRDGGVRVSGPDL